MAHKKIVRSLAKKFINNVTKTALKIVKHQSKIKLKMVNKVDVADHINEFTGGTRRHRRQWDATQFNLGCWTMQQSKVISGNLMQSIDISNQGTMKYITIEMLLNEQEK